MREVFTFDDVLIEPKFSLVESRSLVDTSSSLGAGLNLKLPIISANMASVTETQMAIGMHQYGGLGALHRFMSIEENVEMAAGLSKYCNFAVSVGVTPQEKERADALLQLKPKVIIVDVANGANISVVNMVKYLRSKIKFDTHLMVGNFATSGQINDFISYLNYSEKPDSFKTGVGPGSACSTRGVTGIGVSQLSAIMDCVTTGQVIIADGGINKPADFCKALAAGARAVMLGKILAQTNESSAEFTSDGTHKIYHGSAFGNFGAGNKTSEGGKLLIPSSGPLERTLKHYEGGLRSSMSYCNSFNLTEYQNRAKFIKISSGTAQENGLRGKVVEE